MNIGRRIANLGMVTWHMIRISFQIIHATWKITKLSEPIITIFGSSRLAKTDFYFKQAHQLAQRFVEADISILTGGGPGVMEAFNCGAFLSHKGKGRSIGIGVKGLEESHNPCLHEYFEVNYFFARKLLLTTYADAFVVFPGGFGTLDEFFEVLTLTQTHKQKQVPIVLVGREYWEPIVQWIQREAIAHGLINAQDINLFMVTDDLEKVFCFVQEKCAS